MANWKGFYEGEGRDGIVSHRSLWWLGRRAVNRRGNGRRWWSGHKMERIVLVYTSWAVLPILVGAYYYYPFCVEI